jgi:hypothetical protein
LREHYEKAEEQRLDIPDCLLENEVKKLCTLLGASLLVGSAKFRPGRGLKWYSYDERDGWVKGSGFDSEAGSGPRATALCGASRARRLE